MDSSLNVQVKYENKYQLNLIKMIYKNKRMQGPEKNFYYLKRKLLFKHEGLLNIILNKNAKDFRMNRRNVLTSRIVTTV